MTATKNCSPTPCAPQVVANEEERLRLLVEQARDRAEASQPDHSA